jgi:hypothetical protein
MYALALLARIRALSRLEFCDWLAAISLAPTTRLSNRDVVLVHHVCSEKGDQRGLLRTRFHS